MTGLRRLSRPLAALALSALALPAMAAAPTQEDICDPQTQSIDAERLALALLASADVSNYPYRWASMHPELRHGLSPARYILYQDDFCAAQTDGAGEIKRCAKEDAARIAQAQNYLILIFDSPQSYRKPAGMQTARSLLVADSGAVACLKTASGAAIEVETKAPETPVNVAKIPLRVRGTADGLVYDRQYDAPFAGVDKASITFKDDDAEGKATTKMAAVAGLIFPALANNLTLGPYVGLSIDRTKTDGEDGADPETKTTDHTLRIGGLLDWRLHGPRMAGLISLRPEFASNTVDHSKLITANLTYVPIINGAINAALDVTSKGSALLLVIPRLDLRANWGHFTRIGDRTVEESPDFLRLGTQFGVTVSSAVGWLPVELSVTDTYMHALGGDLADLSQLKTILSFYLDKDKLVGVDLSYTKGRREDLLDREDNWSIGLAAKF